MCQPIDTYDMVHSHPEVSSPEALDTPQRSRNARAQARHRAKRKAYIEKLEENVAKLQAVLGLSTEQLSELPPATVLTNRFAELELENRRLHDQLRALQIQQPTTPATGVGSHPHPHPHVHRYSNGQRWSPDSPTVSEFPGPSANGEDLASVARECKKRKISFDEDALFSHIHHQPIASNDFTRMTPPSASRAHPLQNSVSHAAARGRSADISAAPFSANYGQHQNVPPLDRMNSINIKSESATYGEMTVLSPTTAASPVSMNRPALQHQQSGPIAINHNQQQQPQQAGFRLSFSPNSDPEQAHLQQQSANSYSGIVGNASRSIFGSSDDEAYIPGHPSPLDSRAYSEAQQQYLAHERLTSLAQQGHVRQQQQQQPHQGDLSPASGVSFAQQQQQAQQHSNGFPSHQSHYITGNNHNRMGGQQQLVLNGNLHQTNGYGPWSNGIPAAVGKRA